MMNIYPLSKIQDQFCVIHKMYPDTPAYNQASVFEINGSLNIDFLKLSLQKIIERHQVLRTTFDETAAGPVQVVHDKADISFTLIDMTGLNQDERAQIHRMILAESAAPFDLARGPLLRVRLFVHSETRYHLCITMHHIITDLHSKQLFARELSSFYNSLTGSGKISMEDQKLQYCDYSESENKQHGGLKYSSMLSYWKEKLAGAETFLNLPVDHTRPGLPSLRGDAHEIAIPGYLAEKIREFSAKRSVNIFVAYLSAYYALLHKYTTGGSIITGMPMTNRRGENYETIMGCFMNIVPLRIDNVGNGTYCDLVASVRRALLEAHRNQEVPLEEIVNHVKPARIKGVTPLYQAGFAFEPPMELHLEGVECVAIPVHCGGSQLELFMTLWESMDEIRGRLEYNTDLFEKITISNLVSNYIYLLEALVNNPEKPLARIPMQSPVADVSNILRGDDVPMEGGDLSLNSMIMRQVKLRPDGIAAVFNDKELTYSELDEQSNRLANYLAELGVQPGGIIGVYMERSIEMLIGLVAIHKAGCAYLPLDPEFPQARIRYMAEHSRVPVIITQDSLAGRLPAADTVILPLDGERDSILSKSADNPGIDVKPGDLAYVMYTSGSTGLPKGVQVAHSSVVNFLRSMAERPGMGPDDILLAVTTISFDISVLELFLPLTCGGRTVILSKETAMDGRLLAEAIDRFTPTVMQATPTTWRLLFSSGWAGSKNLKVLCGGEAMPRDIAGKLLDSASSVWNMYGPTETTVWSTCFKVENADGPIYVGTPVYNTYIYILDSEMNFLPPGLPGEIYIGGAGVAKGYINDPDRTGERFLQDPSGQPGSLIYKTGDTGRLTYDGYLEFYSRIDSQVKVRGYRIELPEIEFNLNRHPRIKDSAASVVRDPSGNGRIAGYYVSENGLEPDVVELRRFLQESIPVYMVPDILIRIDSIPLTPNGKIDRKALPEPDFANRDAEREIVLPVSHAEKMLTRIWHDVLSVERIGVYDNYFDLGGNSFLAAEIVNRINREFNSAVTILMMFRYPTISSMAENLSSLRSGEPDEFEAKDFIEDIKSRTAKQKDALLKKKSQKSNNKIY